MEYNDLSFKDLAEANIQRQKEWGGDDKIDSSFRLIETAGEFGELAEAYKKYMRGQHGIQGSTTTLEEVRDELGDCVVALDLLATQLGLSLGMAAKNKFNKTSNKYGFETKL